MIRSLFVLRSSAWQFVSMIAGFAIVPVSVALLGQERYGVWIATVGWLNLLGLADLGSINSARNALAHAFARNDTPAVREILATLYPILALAAGISLSLVLIASLLWAPEDSVLRAAIAIGASFLCFDLVMKAATMIYAANQLPHRIPQSAAISAILILTTLVWLSASFSGELGLTTYVMVVLGLPPIVNAYFTFRLAQDGITPISPLYERTRFSPDQARTLLGAGSLFLIIQVALLVNGQVGNLVVVQKFGGAALAEFAVADKLYGVLSVAGSMLLFPMWSKYTELAAKGQWGDIRGLMTAQERLAGVILAAGLLSLPMFGSIIQLWMGAGFHVAPGFAVLAFAKNFLIVYNSIYSYLMNGLSRIRSQAFIYGLGALFAFPACGHLADAYGPYGPLIYMPVVLLILAIAQRYDYKNLVAAQAAR